ncbi:winged helix-turn-helix domain-containing protein [Actinoplanes sp. LDG1-06]|uniref:Winged helix-turn-helix domain-containing protein n=1 Tax=Paractinoplanes ovalisporus TaxID=2810368 RepID=A0ABS2AVA9_9ACTN|nr:AfsR/SARP family transcriptional regulator [Actinoplanes ovalisporus]MBM2623741.1 winged helix-turn-helix domain-containing protein [Actinoplanes ovalisporus]
MPSVEPVEAGLRYRVLGPMEVGAGAADATPRAAKLRVALAALLLQTNAVVSVQALADELWAERPPRTATMTLQVYVSQLRRILEVMDPERGRDLLVTRTPGYLLLVDPDELDLVVFERLHRRGLDAARRGDDALAASLQRQALRLWRGPLLSDVPHGPILGATAVRMSELRLDALEHRVRADLHLGRHHALVSELRALTSEYALHEDLHAHLMVALYRSGRQADALRAFVDLRRAMVDELGIEPGPALRALHRQVLDGDPELLGLRDRAVVASVDTRHRADAVRLPPAAEFIGRDDVVSEVEAALAEIAAGRPGPACVGVHGMPGAGKSALALRIAHRAVTAFPDGRVIVDMRSPTGGPRSRSEAFAAFLRGTGVTGHLPTDDEELASAVRGLLERERILVVLDNVTSEGQVQPFLPATPGSAVVVTSRAPLTGIAGPASVRLGVLEPGPAARLFAATAGAEAVYDRSDEVSEVAALCGNLPIALLAAGRRVASEPGGDLTAYTAMLRSPESRWDQLRIHELDVRAVLLSGYAAATEPVRRAFRWLSQLPAGGFPPSVVAAVLDIDPAEAATVVHGLVDAQLLETLGTGRSARFRYHELLSVLARELLSTQDEPVAARTAFDRVWTVYLDLCRHADHLLSPGRSFWAGPGAGKRAAAIVGEEPLAWFAAERQSLIQLVGALFEAELWRPGWQLAESLGSYLEAVAAWGDWEATQQLAMDAAARLGDPVPRAVSLASLGDLAWQRRRYPEAEESYRRAAEIAEQSGLAQPLSRALVGLADLRLADGDHARARVLAERALSVSDTAGDLWGSCNALRSLAFGLLGDNRPDDALRAMMECAVLAGRLRHRRFEGFALAAAHRIATLDGRAGSEALEIQPGLWRLSN